LLDKRAQSNFLTQDVHEAQRPLYNIPESDLTATKVYARQCMKHNNAVPFSSLILHHKIRPKLLALVDIHLNTDQSFAFAASLHAFQKDFAFDGVCLVNNRMKDCQSAEVLQALIDEITFVTKVHELTFSMNDIGLEVQQKLLELMKRAPLQHLTLIQNRFKKSASIGPLIKQVCSMSAL
jgi:hypothetical protein